MPRFAANLTLLYTEVSFLERFERARASGFQYVECQFPYQEDISAIASRLSALGLTQVLFNLPAGDWTAGDRGIAAHPDRMAEFRAGVAQAVEVARVLGCRQLNCLAGKRDPHVPLEDQYQVMVENLRFAVRRMDEADLMLVIEVLNPYDVPGFLITTSQAALRLLDAVGVPHLRLQYDFYHMQRVEGELAATLEKNLADRPHPDRRQSRTPPTRDRRDQLPFSPPPP